MLTNKFLIIYAAIAAAILILMIISSGKDKPYYDRLDKKEHPFRFMYPAAAKLYSLLKKIMKLRPGNNVIFRIRSLYVKENIAEELFLYITQKIAMILTILLAVSILGAMLCIANGQISYVKQIQRNDFGSGDALYDLDASYNGESETVQISLDEIRYTKEEILKKFDDSFETVREKMLNENSSAEKVTKPLNLIPEYQGIDIFWEIEDTAVIDYNGTILPELKDTEEKLINIFATFKLDEVSKTYTIPVVVSAGTFSAKQQLIEDIKNSINESNSIHEKTVDLPDSINGKKIYFSKIQEHNEHIFLILGIIAVVVIILGYDRKLDRQIKARNEQMMLDFSDIVTKLSLLYEAGLSILMAWERVVADYEKKHPDHKHFAYSEMRMTLEKIKSGVSEREAYAEFGKRCGLHPYIKLGNILEQNLTKGTKGMKLLLKQEVSDAFEQRKRIARTKGEEASTKLLFPMVLMLVVVIVIIAVPALMTIQL